MRARLCVLGLFAFALTTGCPNPPEPAGSDAGPAASSDGGHVPDAGPDGGAADAGTEPDGGEGHDAGVLPPPRSRPRASVLISGHSLTDNPLADFLAQIASARGKDHDWEQQIGIGSPLRARTWGNGNWEGYRRGKNRHGADMDILAELASPQTLAPGERYDSLLVTDRHDIPGVLQWENTVGHLRHYHDRMVAAHAGATTYFTHTWLDLDRADPAEWMTYERLAGGAWECAAAKVNLTLADEGRADRVVPVPGGRALVELVERTLNGEVRGLGGTQAERLDALFTDNVHLTELGVYFMAAVHFAALYADTPQGAPGPVGVHPDTVADLHAIAWEVIRDYYAAPEPGARTMAECRALLATQLCSPFWTRVGQPQNVGSCVNFFSQTTPAPNGNPFIWPDPHFEPLPAP